MSSTVKKEGEASMEVAVAIAGPPAARVAVAFFRVCFFFLVLGLKDGGDLIRKREGEVTRLKSDG